MSKTAILIDNNTLIDDDRRVEINYDQLSINPQRISFVKDGFPKNTYNLNEIYTISNGYKIGKRTATKELIKIDNEDKEELKDALSQLGVSPNEVRIGGKRKRKTRKSKRPRKSKKSKRKTNRKKI